MPVWLRRSRLDGLALATASSGHFILHVTSFVLEAVCLHVLQLIHRRLLGCEEGALLFWHKLSALRAHSVKFALAAT